MLSIFLFDILSTGKFHIWNYFLGKNGGQEPLLFSCVADVGTGTRENKTKLLS